MSGVYGAEGAAQQATEGRMTFTVNVTDQKITVTNHLDEVPDMDIRLDALPYILLLITIIFGTVVLFCKRRLFR